MGEGGSPYRGAAERPREPRSIECPSCLTAIAADVRRCGHCDVLLDRLRCAGCYALCHPGERSCSRCGGPLAFDHRTEADEAPCPRCGGSLERETAVGLRSCSSCGGVLVDPKTLATILIEAERHPPAAFAASRPSVPHANVMLEEVRYLPCPDCQSSMNRKNFGRTSGVIVDVCKVHGTWFDGGELSRVVAFVAGGGLEKARARKAAEEEQLRQQARIDAKVGARPHAVSTMERREERAVTLVDWLLQLLTLWQ